MIYDQELPMFLWEKVCNIVVYVKNRSPHRILGDKTLEDEFSWVNPEIINLRIFGCPIYIHVHVEKKKKMEPLGQKGIFVWYNET
jgi:hypothetical protein